MTTPLKRLKRECKALRRGSPLEKAKADDLALALAVVDAAGWYMDDASKQTVAHLRKALSEMTEDTK